MLVFSAILFFFIIYSTTYPNFVSAEGDEEGSGRKEEISRTVSTEKIEKIVSSKKRSLTNRQLWNKENASTIVIDFVRSSGSSNLRGRRPVRLPKRKRRSGLSKPHPYLGGRHKYPSGIKAKRRRGPLKHCSRCIVNFGTGRKNYSKLWRKQHTTDTKIYHIFVIFAILKLAILTLVRIQRRLCRVNKILFFGFRRNVRKAVRGRYIRRRRRRARKRRKARSLPTYSRMRPYRPHRRGCSRFLVSEFYPVAD